MKKLIINNFVSIFKQLLAKQFKFSMLMKNKKDLANENGKKI
jgi:hypothetical protein